MTDSTSTAALAGPDTAAGRRAGLHTFARAVVIASRVFYSGTRVSGRWLALRGRGNRQARQLALGEELGRLLEGLGPAFIKVGQVLSARPDLLPPGLVTPLARLQSDVRHIPEAEAERALRDYLDQVGRHHFARVDDTPVAAGSIAQVHHAVLASGDRVALKIRRPGAKRKVARDLALLSRFAGLAERLPACRDMPLQKIIGEISAAVEAQLDFARETANTRRFQDMFRHQDAIRVPKIHDALCRENVLVLEYFPELSSITQGDGLDEAGRQHAALTGLRALYRMIFDDGFVHADMHPGNVFLGEGDDIVLLDAGLVAVLTDKDQRDFVDFFFGLADDDGETCARIVWETALARPGDDVWPRFRDAMKELITSYACLSSREFEITRFVYDLIDMQRRFRIRGSTAFIMTVLSMVVYDGICKTLFPDCDFLAEARGFLIHARLRQNAQPAPNRVFV